MLSRTNWVQSPGDEDVLVVADLETSSALCACADVLAVASISHSEAVTKIKSKILKETTRLPFTTQSEDFTALFSRDIGEERGRCVRWRRWVAAQGAGAARTSAFRFGSPNVQDSTLCGRASSLF
jgi:hypothetical protein